MKKLLIIIFSCICFHLYAQNEVSADWNVSVNGDEITISIIEFNNFTVGLDGHWHYILNERICCGSRYKRCGNLVSKKVNICYTYGLLIICITH